MLLGNRKVLKAELDKIFGNCYTDDNAVVLVEGNQETVALLWVTVNDRVRVEFCDNRPDVTIQVKGARPDSRKVQFFH